MALTEVIMPKTGAEMEEGKIVSWKKKPGEAIKSGEILLEIETDKATMEVESPATGVLLRALFAEDDMVPATHKIAVIGTGSESAAEIDAFVRGTSSTGPAPDAPTAPSTPQAAAAAPTPVETKSSDQRIKASPLAKKLAQEKGVDLANVQGTGPDGRIEKEDVLRAATAKPAASATKAATTSASGEVIHLTPMRKAIIRTVTKSKQEIPEFSVTTQMEMDAALRKKNSLKAEGKKVSVNDLVLLATARTLAAHPDLTSLLDGDTLRRREINLGFALGTDDGLFIPVIRNADKLSLYELAAATAQFAAKAEKKQITEADMSGGTFTVSNLGMFGVESFTAIIVPGQAAILSVGAVTDRPRRDENGGITWHSVMSATLTLDHRIADGVAAAKFLQDLKTRLNEL
jgi:pyruvate dehydrogenase E2 component (dihydrolipoamide acetyltransferase)